MRSFLHQKNNQKKSGYMLIEIMVSLSIFAVVAVSSAGALLAVIDANAKAQSIKSVMDNLSVAVENISRTMRIGTEYKCLTANSASGFQADVGTVDSNVCGPGTAGISFLPQDATSASDLVKYYFIPANGNDQQSGVIRRFRNGVETDLTAPEVNIQSIKFRIIGTGGSGGQPRVMIIINGLSGNTTQTQSLFNIQTTVAERELVQ